MYEHMCCPTCRGPVSLENERKENGKYSNFWFCEKDGRIKDPSHAATGDFDYKEKPPLIKVNLLKGMVDLDKLPFKAPVFKDKEDMKSRMDMEDADE